MPKVATAVEVYCKSCYRVTEYDPQAQEPKNCPQCGSKFSAWHVAYQIKAKGSK